MTKHARRAERAWYEIRAAAETDATDIYVYDVIGEDFWSGGGVTAKQFVADLAAVATPRINLHVNSPGGAVFDGQAIYTALRNHPAEVTTYIDGLAASIASVISLAGDRVVMASNALFMIHDPSGGVLGTAADMRKMADILDRIKDTIVGVYVDASGGDPAAIAEAMAQETWYTAQDALDAGFVDEIAAPIPTTAMFDLSDFGYRHIPDALQRRSTAPAAEDRGAGSGAEPAQGGSPTTPKGDASEVFVPGIGFRHI